jgi:methionyl-tRNA formyltransferase
MADLPFGRGGSPLQNLIVKGFKKTRISAFKVEEELDAGPIYLKKDLSLEGSAEEIFKRASKIIFDEMIPYIIKNNPKPTPQKGETTIFKRRNPEDGNIGNLNNLDKIFDYIRMLDAEGYPPAFVKINRVKIEFSNAEKIKNGIKVSAEIKLENEEK